MFLKLLSLTSFAVSLLLGIFSNKFVTFAHEEVIFTMTISRHLITQFVDYILLSFSMHGEIFLSSVHLIFHIFDPLVVNLLLCGKITKAYPFAEPCVHTILEHPWEPWYCDSISFVYVLDLLVCQPAILWRTDLRVRIWHRYELHFSNALRGGWRLLILAWTDWGFTIRLEVI